MIPLNYFSHLKPERTSKNAETTTKSISILFCLMKKNLFKNSLALFLTGTMLAGVGCKNYDDDIDNLQKEVADLKGQIELKADASAVSALQQKLDGVDFSKFLTSADLSGYVTEEQLGTELAAFLSEKDFSDKVAAIVKEAGYKTQSEIQSMISGLLDKEDVLALFKEQIAAGDTWTTLLPKVQQAIKDEMADYELSEAQKSQAVTAVLAAIADKEDQTGIREAIAGVLGTQFASYMEEYFKTNMETFASNVNASVAAELENAQSDLYKKIESMIEASQIDIKAENVAYLKENDLQAKFDEYDQKITAIWNAIGDLAGRIQSVVFVPTTTNDEIDVHMGGYYIGSKQEIQLASQPKVKIAFRVAPAALAENLAAQINDGKVTASFIPEVVATRAEAPVTYEGTVEAEDGKIIFTAVADSKLYGSLGAGKTYAVALCLSQAAEKDAETGEYKTLGFEITSPYITTDGASEDVTANFVLARSEGGKVIEYNTAATYELPWNSTEKITLMSDYALYYKENDKFLEMDQAASKYLWDEGVAESLAIKYEHTGITYQVQGAGADAYATQTQLTVDPAKVTDKANVNSPVMVSNSAKAAITSVNDVLTLSDKVYVTNGKASVAMAQATVVSKVTILGDLLKTLNINLDFVWKYSSYAAKVYEAEYTVPATDHMNWEKFNQLPDTFSIELVLPAKSAIATNGSAMQLIFQRKEMLNAESAQQFVIRAVNYMTGDGEVEYESDTNLENSESYVKFTGKVTFKGLPAMNYEVKNSEIAEVGADYTVTLDKKFNETLYAQVKDNFKDAAEVATFLQSLTMDYAGVNQAAKTTTDLITLAVNPAIVSGNTFQLAFNSTGINWQKQPSYLYTVPTGTDKGAIVGSAAGVELFTLNLTGSYTLTNTIYQLQPNGAYLYEGVGEANPYMYINGGVNGDAFQLQSINLGNAYSATEEAVKAGAQLSFELVTEEPEGYGANTLPQIAGDWTMNWNNCILDKVTVKAILKNSKGEVLDSKEFDVVLKAPITFDWTFYAGSAIEVSTAEDVSFNLVNKVLSLNAEGKAYTASKNDAAAIDIYGNELYTAATADADAALTALASDEAGYGIEVSYGEVVWSNAGETIEGVTVQDGVITVKKGNEQLAKEIKGTVKVTYTYKYAWVPVVDKSNKVTGYERKQFSFDIPVVFKNAPAIGQ